MSKKRDFGRIAGYGFWTGMICLFITVSSAWSADTVPSAVAVQNAFRTVSKSVTPSVVNISSESTVRTSGQFAPNDPFFQFFGNDEMMQQFFGVPQEHQERSLGTGFIISADGYLISNFHVIKNATKIQVTLSDGKVYKAKVIGTDPNTDVAVLKIEAKDLPAVVLGDSDTVEVGDWAIAIGNPFGLSESMTVGIISAKGRNRPELGGADTYQNFLQTDAPINPGNSGGPLCNIQGEVVGINAAIVAPGGGNVGIGFAIPVNMIKNIVDQLKVKGKVSRGWLGVYIQDVTEEIAQTMRIQPNAGVLVSDVAGNGPAEKAGLRQGDIITEFDGKVMKNVAQLRNSVAATSIGKSVPVKILREGKERTVNMEVGELPSNPEAQASEIVSDQKWLGMLTSGITSETRGKFKLPETQKSGVVILSMDSGSIAAESGLSVGDVIVKINNTVIESMKDYLSIVSQAKGAGSYLFLVKRMGRTVFVGVNIEK